ncbi:hypothetical protein HDR66_00600 [bacterium]|nr:hypothetical protein [bacterium]
MESVSINLAAQSTYFKLKTSSSKDNGIFIDSNSIEFIKPFFLKKDEKGRDTIQVSIFKDDCIRALGNIMCSLPLYTSKNGVPLQQLNPVAIYNELSTLISSFFGESESKVLTGLYFTILQDRWYLWGTEGKKAIFELRKFFVANHTTIEFIKSDSGNLQLRFNTHIVAEHKEDFKPLDVDEAESDSFEIDSTEISSNLSSYLRAMRTKPFLLLAGISGTGKSRIVKQIAFDSCPDNAVLRSDPTSPGNYCLIEVKPNWHDSTELLGYESKIGGAHYQLTPFVKFLAKAMLYPDVPFFVCLDEMNLAPVEQYFAEFLSVLESRTKFENGHIVSEPLIKAEIFRKYNMEKSLFSLEEEATAYNNASATVEPQSPYGKEIEVYNKLREHGLRIPENVVVIGTVNMDETTHQFSRKVIDRAMTIEMNLPEGNPFMDFFANASDLSYRSTPTSASLYLATETKAKDVIEALSADNAEKTEWLKGEIAGILTALNNALDGTPFKVAYRVQNELMLYFYQLWLEDKTAKWREILNTSVDQILMMKVLPRVEGDEELLEKPLDRLIEFAEPYTNAKKKLDEMKQRLQQSRFASFWP